MSQYDKLVRLKEFELDEKRRDAGSILSEINRLTEKKQSLDVSLKQEQDISSSSIEALGQYSNFASRVKKEREIVDGAIAEVEKAYVEEHGPFYQQQHMFFALFHSRNFLSFHQKAFDKFFHHLFY